MRKTITIASLATAGMFALVAPAGATVDEPTEPSLTAEAECGTVTVTLVNAGPRLRGVDFGYGDPTLEIVDPALVINEGPFAGEPFGLFYEAPNGVNFTVAAGETGSETLDIPEDEGGGTVTVRYRVRFGPEQLDHMVGGEIEVDTDCEDPVPPTTVPAEEPPATTQPPVEPDPLPQIVETPAPVEVESQVETADVDELAFTGSNTVPAALFGAGLLTFGAGALAVARRREVRS